jgi:glutamate/aspartate transport system substrate-binding protein
MGADVNKESAVGGSVRAMGIAGVLLAASCVAAHAQTVDAITKKLRDTNSITMGYRETIPPTSFLDDSGKPAGYSVDMCHSILEAIRTQMKLPALKITNVPVTLQTREALVANGTVDIECGGTVNTFARSHQVDFTPVTYVASNQFLALKSTGIKDLKDLNGKIIAIAGSGSSVKDLNDLIAREKLNVKLLNVDDHAAALIAIESRRADAYFSDNSAFYGLVKQSRHPEALAIVGPEIGYAPQGFMIPKNNPEFLWMVDHQMAKMFESGEAEKIYMKWFGPYGGSVGPKLRAAWETASFPE